VFEKVDLRDKAGGAESGRAARDNACDASGGGVALDRSSTGRGDFIHTNIVGNIHLLEACRGRVGKRLKGKRFHHVSTDEVYGSLGPTGFFTEQTPYAPNSPYSSSKASSDMLVRAYLSHLRAAGGITNCSKQLRAVSVSGKVIPVVIQSVLSRSRCRCSGDGMNVRDWLYVRGPAEALWQVFTRGKDRRDYNIGGHNEWANLRIVD